MARKKKTQAEVIEEKVDPMIEENIKRMGGPVEEKALVPVTDHELAAYEDIPDAAIDTTIAAGADVVNWAKNTSAGFVFGDRVKRDIQGRIVYLYPHLIHWQDATPTKIPDPGDGQPMPEGFEKRCDVHLLTSDNFLVGISIPQSSYRRNFSGYIQSLKNMNKKPNEVLTHFVCKEKRAKDRSFPAIEASFVGDAFEDDVPF